MNILLPPPLGTAKPAARGRTSIDLNGFDLMSMADFNKWEIPYRSSFDVGNPTRMTIRLRVVLRANLTNNGIITKSSLSSSQGDWAVGFFNGSSRAPSFRVNNNGTTLQSSNTLSLDTMYFIECTYDQSLGSNQLKMFVNGALDCQGTYTTAITNNATPICFGRYFGITGNDFQNGAIFEMEFCASCIRNTVAYTTPALIIPDSQSTVYYRAGVYFPR